MDVYRLEGAAAGAGGNTEPAEPHSGLVVVGGTIVVDVEVVVVVPPAGGGPAGPTA